MADNELGRFLRTRREAASPAAVGLAVGVQRNTPGLRLEELATLAGVSVQDLTRLEQGHDHAPSHQLLAALADTLRLSPEDRHQLVLLSSHEAGVALLTPATRPDPLTIRSTVRAVLDRLDPTPAIVINRIGDILASTEGGRRLLTPIGMFDGPQPNLSRYVFTDPRSRTVYPHWDEVADRVITQLRLDACPDTAPLVEELTLVAGDAVSARMEGPAEIPHLHGELLLDHPTAGRLRLAYETLDLSIVEEQHILIYLPTDDETAQALGRLGAGPVAD